MPHRTFSPRPVRLIAETSRHPDRNRARPRSHHHPIAFHRPAVFFQARLAGRRLSATHPRLVLRLALSRLAERLAIIYIGLCPYMPYSLYRPVGSCSSGLVCLRLIARRST